MRTPRRAAPLVLAAGLTLALRAPGAEPPDRPVSDPPRLVPFKKARFDDYKPSIRLKKEGLDRALATVNNVSLKLEERVSAVGLLGLARVGQAVPALVRLLRRPDHIEMKVAAVWALREIGDPAGIPALLQVQGQAAGSDPRLRYDKKIAFPDEAAELSFIELIEDAIGRLGAVVVDRYVKILYARMGAYPTYDEKTVNRQRAALAVIVCIGDRDQRAINAMMDIVKSPGKTWAEDFRQMATVGLARVLVERKKEFDAVRARDKLGDEIAKLLVDMITKIKPSRTREHIAGALYNARPVYAVTLLVRHFADNSPEDVRLRTIEALSLLRSRESTEALVWALEHEKNPELRWRAAFGLGLSGKSGQARAALTRALRDKAPAVKRAAIEALGKVAGKDAVPLVAPSVRDTDPQTRAATARALGLSRDPSAIPHLLTAAKDEDAAVRATAVAALGALPSRRSLAAIVKAARDAHRPVRFAALKVLGNIHTTDAYAALLGLVSDPDRKIRAEATNNLYLAREHHPKQFKRALIRVIGDPDHPASADACDLANFPKDTAVVGALRKATGDKRAGVRASARRMLRRMGQNE